MTIKILDAWFLCTIIGQIKEELTKKRVWFILVYFLRIQFLHESYFLSFDEVRLLELEIIKYVEKFKNPWWYILISINMSYIYPGRSNNCNSSLSFI